ncbi:MAG TPA: class I SAM-dependent methyltransferase [Thermoanaerobaculia bacterium]
MSAGGAADVYRERVYENDGLPALVALFRPEDRRILDVGCGAGANMRLLAATGRDVAGVTLSEEEACAVRASGFTCHVCDVERDDLPVEDASVDALVFSHVLEHMAWPETVLRRHLRVLRPGGSVYVVVPNPVQFRQRWEFIRGRFRYTETGIMDRTHLRFFDFVAARELLVSAGLEVVHHAAAGHVPLGPLRRVLRGLAPRLDAAASRRWPGLFGYHLLVAGRLA